MRKIIVAIDGYSGTGKSSTAKMVAKELSYTFIDSGAMYRAVTWYLITNNTIHSLSEDVLLDGCTITFDDEGVCLNGVSIEDSIRSMEVNEHVSKVSAISSVRKKLVSEQRKMSQHKGVVMDGRDIGTVVFPHAELKVFMTADMSIRVQRRKKQLEQKGVYEEEEVIRQNLVKRDSIDTSRDDSPLVKADDAIEIDTSYMSLNEQVERVVQLATQQIKR